MRDAQKHTASLLGVNASFNCLMPRAAPHATRKRLLMNSTSRPQAREARSVHRPSDNFFFYLLPSEEKQLTVHTILFCVSQNHSVKSFLIT